MIYLVKCFGENVNDATHQNRQSHKDLMEMSMKFVKDPSEGVMGWHARSYTSTSSSSKAQEVRPMSGKWIKMHPEMGGGNVTGNVTWFSTKQVVFMPKPNQWLSQGKQKSHKSYKKGLSASFILKEQTLKCHTTEQAVIFDEIQVRRCWHRRGYPIKSSGNSFKQGWDLRGKPATNIWSVSSDVGQGDGAR